MPTLEKEPIDLDLAIKTNYIEVDPIKLQLIPPLQSTEQSYPQISFNQLDLKRTDS